MDIGSNCTVLGLSMRHPASSTVSHQSRGARDVVNLGACYVGLIKSSMFRVMNSSAESWADVVVSAWGKVGTIQVLMVSQNYLADENVAVEMGARDLVNRICKNEAMLRSMSTDSSEENKSSAFSRLGAHAVFDAMRSAASSPLLDAKDKKFESLGNFSQNVPRAAEAHDAEEDDIGSSWFSLRDADGDTRPFSLAADAKMGENIYKIVRGAVFLSNEAHDDGVITGAKDWRFQIPPSSEIGIQILILPMDSSEEAFAFETKWSASTISPNKVAFRTKVAACSIDPIHSMRRCVSLGTATEHSIVHISGEVARSCIEVLPKQIDLGECNVGEYRSGAITIKNSSSVDSVILPIVESATITFSRRVVKIKAWGSVTVPFDFVAHDVDASYSKLITLVNLRNPMQPAVVEVRAKNIDSHHILAHSMFYKLYTYISTKQLLVQYDACLFSRPNVKFISVRNIYSSLIRVKLYSQDTASLCVLFCPGISLNADGHIVGALTSNGDAVLSSGDSLTFSSDLLECISIATNEASFPFSYISSISANNIMEESKTPVDGSQVPTLSGRPRSASSSASLGQYPLLRASESVASKLQAIDQSGNSIRTIDAGINIVDKCYNAIEKVVSEVQKQKEHRCFEDLGGKGAFDEGTAGCVVNIAVGLVAHFLVVLKPVASNRTEELDAVDVLKQLHIELLDVSTQDVLNCMSSRGLAVPDSLLQRLPQDAEGLSVRKVPVHAVATRSEFEILQKNINFGKVLVGSVSLRSVTLVNLSNIPLLYAILKTGSISSGFLEIASGEYRGIISSKSSVTIQFKFKPVLPGNFEETLIVRNVLNNSNSRTIVIKSLVVKPDSFIISPVLSDVSDALFSVDNRTEEASPGHMDLEARIEADTVVPQNDHPESTRLGDMDPRNLVAVYLNKMLNSKSVVKQSAIPPVNIGELYIGELYRDKISFKIRNVSAKMRHYIIDAAHSQALVLLSTNLFSAEAEHVVPLDETEAPPGSYFESGASPLNICSLACEFSVLTPGASRKSMEEREALADKLEGFRQKLKIAVRKNKVEKISKLEKRIKEILDALSDVAPIGTMKVNSEQSDRAVRDTTTLHLQLQPGEEVLVSVGVTILPTLWYKPWVGPSPFLGCIRVSESRNDDVVKNICFGALVNSHEASLSKKVLDLKNKDTDVIPDLAIPKGRKREVGNSAIQVYAGEDAELLVDVVSGSGQPAPQRLLLAAISPWCAYHTKNIIPAHRRLYKNVLGVSIKLAPFERASETTSINDYMYGAISVTSTANEPAILEITFDYDCSSYISGLKFCDLASDLHGALRLAVISPQDDWFAAKAGMRTTLVSSNTEFVHNINKLIAPGETVNILIEWNPLGQEVFDKLFLAMLVLRMSCDASKRNEAGSTFSRTSGPYSESIMTLMYVPTICLVERNSIMKVDKYVNLGEVALGKVKTLSICITNLHKSVALHYKASALTLDPSIFSGGFGRVRIVAGSTGVIEPTSSRNIQLFFVPTRIGKFEQEILVTNMGDSFDQKRVVVSAYVQMPQSRFILLPDILELESKCLLDLGLVQLPSANASADWYHKHAIKPFRIVNVSEKKLFVSADSNIRNQCSIFVDFDCKVPLSLLPLSPSISTTVYIRLRRPGGGGAARFYRSSLVSIGANMSSGFRGVLAEEDSEGGVARTLSGGIRLSFFELTDSNPSLTQEPETASVALTADQYKRFLEIPVQITARVGSSLLGIISRGHTYRCVPVGTASCNRVLRGFFELRNLSIDFEANYSYVKSHYCTSNSSIDFDSYSSGEIASGQFEFGIIGDSSGVLAPLESRDVEFYVVYSALNGLVAKNIELLNNDTGRKTSVNLTFFFDSRRIISSCPSVVSVQSKASHTRRNVDACSAANKRLQVSLADGAPGIRYCRSVIATDIETVECCHAIWVESGRDLSIYGQGETNVKTRGIQSFTDCSYIVTGCANRKSNCIGFINVYNAASTSITISPVSTLPVRLVSIKSNGPHDFGKHNESCPIGKSFTLLPEGLTANLISTRQIRLKPASNIMLSQRENMSKLKLPDGVWKSDLSKCGEPITLGPWESCVMHICCDIGAAVPEFSENHEPGVALKREGFLALLSSTQELTDLFRSPNAKRNMEISDSDCAMPVFSFMRLTTEYVSPKLRLVYSKVDLEGLKSRTKSDFKVVIDNISDSECPFSIKDAPSWIRVDGAWITHLSSEGGDANLGSLESISSGTFILPPRQRAVVAMIIDSVPDVPGASTSTCLRHSIYVCNMSRAYSQFKYEKIPLELNLHILPSQAIQLFGVSEGLKKKRSVSPSEALSPSRMRFFSLGAASVYRTPSNCSEESIWMVTACSKKSPSFQIRNVLSIPVKIHVTLTPSSLLENSLELRMLFSGGLADARIINLSPGETADVNILYAYDSSYLLMSSLEVLQPPRAPPVSAAALPRPVKQQQLGRTRARNSLDSNSNDSESSTESSSAEVSSEDEYSSTGSDDDANDVSEMVVRLLDASGCERPVLHFGCRQVGLLCLSPYASRAGVEQGGTEAAEDLGEGTSAAERFDEVVIALGTDFSCPIVNIG